MTASEDTSKFRRALTVLAVLAAVFVLLVVVARCSSPSTIHTGEATADSGDALNAAAAGLAAVTRWADGPGELVRVRWLDPDTAVVTVRLGTGEHVTVTALRGAAGWAVPSPPSPAPAEPVPAWPALSAENLVHAREDQRWKVTEGFLAAWLASEPTERWTAVNFDAPPLGVRYDSWEVTGLATPMVVPGTSVEVVAVDFEATTEGLTRGYRAFVGVTVDPAGRWTVTAVGHRPPT